MGQQQVGRNVAAELAGLHRLPIRDGFTMLVGDDGALSADRTAVVKVCVGGKGSIDVTAVSRAFNLTYADSGLAVYGREPISGQPVDSSKGAAPCRDWRSANQTIARGGLICGRPRSGRLRLAAGSFFK